LEISSSYLKKWKVPSEENIQCHLSCRVNVYTSTGPDTISTMTNTGKSVSKRQQVLAANCPSNGSMCTEKLA